MIKTVKYRLIKHETSDGLMSVYADVPIGKVYDVIEGSETDAEFFNTELKKNHTKKIVSVIDNNDKRVYFPLECLERVRYE